MNIKHKETIEGRSIYYFDLTNEQFRSIRRFASAKIKSPTWELNLEVGTGYNDDVPIVQQVPTQEFDTTEAWEVLKHLILKTKWAPKLEVLNPYNVGFNCTRPSDSPKVHRDMFAPEEFDITVLVYLNSTWDKDWGGETVFFDEEGEVEFSLLPKRNRIEIHEGYILHASRPPNYSALERFRLTMAIKINDALQ